MSPKQEQAQPSGLVIIDKPKGLSSNQTLGRVKRLLRTKKAGHAGTLDPEATGMLPICLGRATRLNEYLLASDKCYIANIELGTATDTADGEGQVVATQAVPALTIAAVKQVLANFTGPIAQVPPMYSALKVNGKKLYQLARAGQTIERAARQVVIKDCKLIELQDNFITIEVTCSKGTYIRVLAEDIAAKLNTVGHLADLRRKFCAGFAATTMVTLEQLSQSQQPRQWLLPMLAALPDWPKVELTAEQLQCLVQGKTVHIDADSQGQVAFTLAGELVAVGRIEAGVIAKRKLLL